MSPDPKWLEILKASGWQTATLAAAGITLLYLNAKRLLLPATLDSKVIEAIEVAVVVFGFLTVSSIGPHLAKKWSGLWNWFAHLLAVRRSKHQVEQQIPFM
jgi:hypothetical protein